MNLKPSDHRLLADAALKLPREEFLMAGAERCSNVTVDRLASYYDVVHASFKELRAMTGLTQKELADRTLVPYRTVQNWESRDNEPLYVKLLIAEALGILKLW